MHEIATASNKTMHAVQQTAQDTAARDDQPSGTTDICVHLWPSNCHADLEPRLVNIRTKMHLARDTE